MEQLTSNQQRIDSLIRSTIDFCSKIEIKNPGITEWFMIQDIYNNVRRIEKEIDRLFEEDDLLAAITRLASHKEYWMRAVNSYRSNVNG
jgi:hypothetical protein